MVERPADVLPMDPAKPVKMDWFIRWDRACRRLPGIGVFLCFLLLQFFWRQEMYIAFGLAVVGVVFVTVEEFMPELISARIFQKSA